MTHNGEPPFEPPVVYSLHSTLGTPAETTPKSMVWQQTTALGSEADPLLDQEAFSRSFHSLWLWSCSEPLTGSNPIAFSP